MKTKTRWEKAYRGPFEKKEAIEIIDELKIVADPEKNGIEKIAIRKRPRKIKCVCTASCGAGLGHNSYKYDVFIKTNI